MCIQCSYVAARTSILTISIVLQDVKFRLAGANIISGSRGYNIIVKGCNEFSLRISNINQTDFGEYECVFDGRLSASARLEIGGKSPSNIYILYVH